MKEYIEKGYQRIVKPLIYIDIVANLLFAPLHSCKPSYHEETSDSNPPPVQEYSNKPDSIDSLTIPEFTQGDVYLNEKERNYCLAVGTLLDSLASPCNISQENITFYLGETGEIYQYKGLRDSTKTPDLEKIIKSYNEHKMDPPKDTKRCRSVRLKF